MPQLTSSRFLDEVEKLPSGVKTKCAMHMSSSTFNTDELERSDNNPNIKRSIKSRSKKKWLKQLLTK